MWPPTERVFVTGGTVPLRFLAVDDPKQIPLNFPEKQKNMPLINYYIGFEL